jgi:hypothetical protein
MKANNYLLFYVLESWWFVFFNRKYSQKKKNKLNAEQIISNFKYNPYELNKRIRIGMDSAEAHPTMTDKQCSKTRIVPASA